MNFNTYNTQNNIYINDILLSYKNKDNQPFIAASIFSFFFYEFALSILGTCKKWNFSLF